MKLRLILASSSPRRRELLKQIGAEFEIFPAQGEEVITSVKPEQTVLELSRQKAQEVADCLLSSGERQEEKIFQTGEIEKTLILGADTVVAFGGKILGKPKDREDAIQMLQMLSGSTHSVFTGVTIVAAGEGGQKAYSFYEETKVTMYPMPMPEILSYIQTGEPMDKAGAYGIQGKGAVYIERIQGDYNNVVGLPVARIFQEMQKTGIDILHHS